MNIAFFGPSRLATRENETAAYYRGILRALHQRGHFLTLYEPEAVEKTPHCAPDPLPWADVVVYKNEAATALEQAEMAGRADLVVKATGIGVFDALLEEAIPDLRRPGNLVAFWDAEVSATLETIHSDSEHPLHRLISRYDLVLTRGGGTEVLDAYEALGARHCVPVRDALDPSLHFPAPAEECFRCDLAFLADHLPQREERADEFFFQAARQLPGRRFLLAGEGWETYPLPPNVRTLGPLCPGVPGTDRRNAVNRSASAVLNVNRPGRVTRYGHSPGSPLFAAAGAGACVISEEWDGLEDCFEPDYEILIARNGEEVSDQLEILSPARARQIGEGALRRGLAQHTLAHRAAEVEAALEGRLPAPAVPIPF